MPVTSRGFYPVWHWGIILARPLIEIWVIFYYKLPLVDESKVSFWVDRGFFHASTFLYSSLASHHTICVSFCMYVMIILYLSVYFLLTILCFFLFSRSVVFLYIYLISLSFVDLFYLQSTPYFGTHTIFLHLFWSISQ